MSTSKYGKIATALSLILLAAFPLVKNKIQANAQPRDVSSELTGFVTIQGDSISQIASPSNPKPGDSLQQEKQLPIMQKNTLPAVSSHITPPPTVVRTINAVVTAYSSTPSQTDDTPFITAAGTPVEDGVIANNILPFGTKIKIPSLFGDKIFVVEDRMNKKWANNRFDIWFASTPSAKNFGIKNVTIEVVD